MVSPQGIVAQLCGDEALTQQLRQGNLAAFEKLNLSFDELYFVAENESQAADGVACLATCLLTADGIGLVDS
jgi:hypothetical protein